MFAGGIALFTIDRANGSLAGDAALKLTSDFVAAAFFEWVSTSTGEKRATDRNQKGDDQVRDL